MNCDTLILIAALGGIAFGLALGWIAFALMEEKK